MENNVRELDPITFLVSDSPFRNDLSESGDPEKSSASGLVVDDESLSAEGLCLVLLSADDLQEISTMLSNIPVQGERGTGQEKYA
jgi:hypothetical protein